MPQRVKVRGCRCQPQSTLTCCSYTLGFFYVTGHGIPQTEIDAAFALSRRFFDLAPSAKAATTGESSNPHYVLGYSREDTEEGMMREGFLCGHDNSRMRELWPAQLPEFRTQALGFMSKVQGVVARMMSAFALGLGLEESHFLQHMDVADDANATALFFNHYPSVVGRALPASAMRIWAHTDFEMLTLLFSTRPGLEVCPGKTCASAADALAAEKWRDVDPVEGALTCNLGDALQLMTGGALKSTYHRVRAPRPQEWQGERFSLAYFANVHLHTTLALDASGAPITFLDLLAKRAATVPLVLEPVTGRILVTELSGKAGGPDFA